MARLEGIRWPVAEWRSVPVENDAAALWWLGQSGFAVRHAAGALLIDPYLSNSLAKKYAGTRFPHVRMMPVPAAAEFVADTDLVLCTHRHTDHMDPETLAVISENTNVRFVVPAALVTHAVEKVGLDPQRIVAVNAGQTIEPTPGTRIFAVPAAHEHLETNSNGEYVALGYVIALNGVLSIYHAGDCVPYPGLESWLRTRKIHVGILPVNGRDAERTAAGVLGNFTLNEALDLCERIPFQNMIVAHFGMFEFNTVDPALLHRRIGETGNAGRVLVPQVDVAYRVWGEHQNSMGALMPS